MRASVAVTRPSVRDRPERHDLDALVATQHRMERGWLALTSTESPPVGAAAFSRTLIRAVYRFGESIAYSLYTCRFTESQKSACVVSSTVGSFGAPITLHSSITLSAVTRKRVNKEASIMEDCMA